MKRNTAILSVLILLLGGGAGLVALDVVPNPFAEKVAPPPPAETPVAVAPAPTPAEAPPPPAETPAPAAETPAEPPAAATVPPAATPAPAKTPAVTASQPVYKEFVQGNAKAKVTVIEYASLTCPHCAHFMAEGFPQLKKDYIDTGKIKFIYRDFPLDNLALGAAVLARCVPNSRGEVMVEMMFKNQVEWMRSDTPLEVLRGYAQLAGLDSAGVDACLKNEPIVKQIRDVQERASTTFKVESTPTFFVGEDKVAGNDYEALKKAIDKQLPSS